MNLLPDTSTLRASRRATFRLGRLAFRSAIVVTLVLGLVAPVIAQDPPSDPNRTGGTRVVVGTATVYVPAGAPEDRPQKRDCNAQADNDNRSKAEKINDRIDCRTENLNVEVSTLVDQAVDSEDIFTDTQKENLKNLRTQGENARKRTKEAGGFKGIGRKQKSTCYVQEYDTADTADDEPNGLDDGNNDGVCSNRGGAKETCAEVLGDGIGDDDGICKTTGNPKEVCVEICENASNDEDDDNFDDEAAADMEQVLVDAESVLAETNQKVAAGLKAFAQAKQALATSSVSGDHCNAILGGVRIGVGVALTYAADVFSMAYDIVDSGCNQDVLGNNCSAVGVALATMKGIAQIVKDGWFIADAALTESGFDKSLNCQEQTATQQSNIQITVNTTQAQLDVTDGRVGVIDGKVDALQVTVGGTNDKVEEIERKVDILNARLGEVLELLNTPPGRRPDFPR